MSQGVYEGLNCELFLFLYLFVHSWGGHKSRQTDRGCKRNMVGGKLGGVILK